MSAPTHLAPFALPTFDFALIGDAEIEQRVRQATNRIRELQRAAIVDIGRELIVVKAALPDGTFLKWIEASFGWSRRTAVNFMQVAHELGPVWEAVSHLPTTALYVLASPSTPGDVREAVLKLRPGESVTTKNIRFAIDASKKIAARKERRAKRHEIAAGREAYRARFEAEVVQHRLKEDQDRGIAKGVAERIRCMLSANYAEACDLLSGVDQRVFARVLFEMIEADRIDQKAEVRP